MVRAAVVWGLALLACPPALGASWRPLARFELMGGQAQSAARDAFSGTAALQLGGGAQLSARDVVIPILSGQYRRVGQVQDVSGEGVVAAESLDAAANVRWVRKASDRWTLKPTLGFRRTYFKASSAERLGAGIFDFDKTSAGLDAEYAKAGRTYRLGASAYRVSFPRFRAAQSNGVSGFGDRVLDFTALDVSLGVERELASARVGASWTGSARLFSDQRLALADGALSDRARRDLFQQVSVYGSRASRWASPGLALAYRRLDSNQNAYFPEASQTRMRYYDYDEANASPSLSARVGAYDVRAAFDCSVRLYRARASQDESGAAVGGLVRQTVQTASLNGGRALGRGVYATASLAHTAARANTRYEPSGYRYTYSVTSAFAGLSYAY